MEEMDLPEIEVGNAEYTDGVDTICCREMKEGFNMLRRKQNF